MRPRVRGILRQAVPQVLLIVRAQGDDVATLGADRREMILQPAELRHAVASA